MNKIFSTITTLSFSLIAFTIPLHADNNNLVPSQETQQSIITETKNALIKELCEISFTHFLSTPDDSIHYFIKPIESEFKALGFSKMPFEQTVKKPLEDKQTETKQLKELALSISFSVLDDYFSEQELKELLEVYKNPLFQKHIKFLGSGWFSPLIDVLKDPKLYEKYESKINQFINLIKDPKIELKSNELVTLGVKEFQTFVDFIKENNVSIKEKFNTQFPAIAPFFAPSLFEKKH